MDKVLIFYLGKKEEFNKPESFVTLQAAFKEKYQISDEDMKEMIFSYVKDENKIEIKSNEDYEVFVKENIGELKVKKKAPQEVADLKNEIKKMREDFIKEKKRKERENYGFT